MAIHKLGPALRAGALVGLGLAALLGCPGEVGAFCGFFVSGADAQLYNNASQVALVRKGNHTVMTLANNYKGPPEDFAMVVPVPVVLQKEQVKTLAADVFKHIDELSAPRLVEYWEQDPCYVLPKPSPMLGMAAKSAGAPRRMARESADDLGVTIEAKFEVGEYQILILSARDSSGLDKWLHLNKYKIPQGAGDALAPYIRDQMKFFVAKVDIKKVKRDEHGLVVLSPLRFGFDDAELRLPVRLGLLNAESKQDLIVYLLSPDSRFEVANYPNVFVPTNLEVADAVRKSFGSFYAELFDETLRQHNNKAVITEYSWQTSSCDPCPTPPLQTSELYTLADEQIFPELAQSLSVTPPPGAPPTALAAPPRSQPGRSLGRRPWFGGGPSWVLTRLHTRYDKQTLSEDLLFRTAKPVAGGRANWDGTLGDQGAQIQDGGTNNFQGRYIIRHYWEGPVACSHPVYGRWGGPPAGTSKGAAQPARDLANAPRGKLKLAEVVQSPLPALGLKGVVRKLRPGEGQAQTPR